MLVSGHLQARLLVLNVLLATFHLMLSILAPYVRLVLCRPLDHLTVLLVHQERTAPLVLLCVFPVKVVPIWHILDLFSV